MGTTRFGLLALASSLLLAACGGGMSLTEYAEEVEAAVAEMQVRILATDAALAEPTTSLAAYEAIWRERVAARREFLGVIETFDPPDEADALHTAATDIVGRLALAEAAVADQVNDYGGVEEVNSLGTTPAFRGFLEVNEEATNVCLAAQGMFDDTAQREVLADVSWITADMKEVIEVVFDCVPSET
jgi:hypothetical protein